MTIPASAISILQPTPPPFRASPLAEDPEDAQRITWAWTKWDTQTGALIQRDRTIEECVRMLCGQQDIVWSNAYQRFVDIGETLGNADMKWRHRPRINLLSNWYTLTKARMTENPPILTFVPGPDAIDAALAETMDTLFKSQWRDLGMQAVHDKLVSWIICGGRSYLESRLDASLGPMQEWRGQAEIPVLDPETGDDIPDPTTGQAPWMMTWDDVPFDGEGKALSVLVPGPMGMEPIETAPPYSAPEGQLVPEALSPLEVRGEWGPTPWHQKRWHAKRSFLTVDQVHDRYGVMVEADTTGISSHSNGYLERLLFGSGNYGSAGHSPGSRGTVVQTGDAFVETLTLWEAPNRTVPGYAQEPGKPGGRLLVVTRTKVLWDSQRPLAFKYTSPIRCFDFFQFPGRPSGTTPQEFLNPLQRAYNRLWGSITEHAAKMTNPMMLVAKGSGLDSSEITNEVGQKFDVVMNGTQQAVQYVECPPLGSDVYTALDKLRQEFDSIGSLMGTEGIPDRDASGKLVQELRFNSDRYLGSTMRAMVEEYGRMAEDWMTIFPVWWPVEKIIRYAGEDYVARTLTVLPMIFEGGSVNVQPDVESMLPEGRGERQERVKELYGMGLLDPSQMMDLAKFPNMNRTTRPGGQNRVTAEHLLGRLLQGDQTVIQPTPDGVYPQLWYPTYDPNIHLLVLSNYINSPEFLNLDEPLKNMLLVRWQFVNGLAQQAAAAAFAQQVEQNNQMNPPKGEKPLGDDRGFQSKPAAQRAKNSPLQLASNQ